MRLLLSLALVLSFLAGCGGSVTPQPPKYGGISTSPSAPPAKP